MSWRPPRRPRPCKVFPPLTACKRTKSPSTVLTSVGKFCANTSREGEEEKNPCWGWKRRKNRVRLSQCFPCRISRCFDSFFLFIWLNCFQCRDQIVPFTPTLRKVNVGLMCALPSWGALWCFWSFVIWSHDPTSRHPWETTGIEVFFLLNCVQAILQEDPLSLKCVYTVIVFVWIVARFLCYMVNMCETWVSPESEVLLTPGKKYSTAKKWPEGMC